jgi:hypothetical protein
VAIAVLEEVDRQRPPAPEHPHLVEGR